MTTMTSGTAAFYQSNIVDGVDIFHQADILEFDSGGMDRKDLEKELSKPGHEHALDKFMLSHFSKKPKSKGKKKTVKKVTPLLYIPNETHPSLVTIDQAVLDDMLGKTHGKTSKQKRKNRKPDGTKPSVLQETSLRNSNIVPRLPPPEHITVIKEVDVMPTKGDKSCPEEMVKCAICNVKFENRSRLALHMRVHRRCINTGSKRRRRLTSNSSALMAKYVQQNNLNDLTECSTLPEKLGEIDSNDGSKTELLSFEATDILPRNLNDLETDGNIIEVNFETFLEIAGISRTGSLQKSCSTNLSQTSLHPVSYSNDTNRAEHSHVNRSEISFDTNENMTGSTICVETNISKNMSDFQNRNETGVDSVNLSTQSIYQDSPEKLHPSRNDLEINALHVLRRLCAQKSPHRKRTRKGDNSNSEITLDKTNIGNFKGDNSMTETFCNNSPIHKTSNRGDNSSYNVNVLQDNESPCSRMIEFVKQIENVCQNRKCEQIDDCTQNDKHLNDTDEMVVESHCSNSQPYLDDITFHSTTRYCGIPLQCQSNTLINISGNCGKWDNYEDHDFCSRVSPFTENMKHYKEWKSELNKNCSNSMLLSHFDKHLSDPDSVKCIRGVDKKDVDLKGCEDHDLEDNKNCGTNSDNLHLKSNGKNLSVGKLDEVIKSDDMVTKTRNMTSMIYHGGLYINQKHEQINLQQENLIEQANVDLVENKNGQNENAQSENAQSENAQSENAQSENAQNENAQSENEIYHSDSDIFREDSSPAISPMSIQDQFFMYRPPKSILDEDSRYQSINTVERSCEYNESKLESKTCFESQEKDYIEKNSPEGLESMIYLKNITLYDEDGNEKREITKNELRGDNYSEIDQENGIKKQEANEQLERGGPGANSMKEKCSEKTSVVKNLFDEFTSKYSEAEINVYGRIMKSNPGQSSNNHDSYSDSSNDDSSTEDSYDYDNDKHFNDHDDKLLNDHDNDKYPHEFDSEKLSCDHGNYKQSNNYDYEKNFCDLDNIDGEALLKKCSRMCSFQENMTRILCCRKHKSLETNGQNKNYKSSKTVISNKTKKKSVTKRTNKEIKEYCSPNKIPKVDSQHPDESEKSGVKERASKDRKTKVIKEEQSEHNTGKQLTQHLRRKSKNSIPRRSPRKNSKFKDIDLNYNTQNRNLRSKNFKNGCKIKDEEKTNHRNIKKPHESVTGIKSSPGTSVYRVSKNDIHVKDRKDKFKKGKSHIHAVSKNARKEKQTISTKSQSHVKNIDYFNGSPQRNSPRKSQSPLKYKDYFTGNPQRNSPRKSPDENSNDCIFNIVPQSPDFEYVRKSPRKIPCKKTCGLQCCLRVHSIGTNQTQVSKGGNEVGALDNSNHGNSTGSSPIKSQGNLVNKQLNPVGALTKKELKTKKNLTKNNGTSKSPKMKEKPNTRNQKDGQNHNRKDKNVGNKMTETSRHPDISRSKQSKSDKNVRNASKGNSSKEIHSSQRRKKCTQKPDKEKGRRRNGEKQKDKDKFMVKLFGSAFRNRRKQNCKFSEQKSEKTPSLNTIKTRYGKSQEFLHENESKTWKANISDENESRTISEFCDSKDGAFSKNTKSPKSCEKGQFKTPEKTLESDLCANDKKLTTPKKRWTALFQRDECQLKNSDKREIIEFRSQEISHREDNSPLNLDILNVDVFSETREIIINELPTNEIQCRGDNSHSNTDFSAEKEHEKCFWTSDSTVIERMRKLYDSDEDDCQTELHDGKSYTCARFIKYSRYCHSARTLPLTRKFNLN